MCRQAFTETDTPVAVDIRQYITVESRRLTPGEVEAFRREFRRDLQRELQDRYMLRPLEWVVFEGPDPVDIAFIVEKTDLDAESAKAYLAFYKNPIELINQVTWKDDSLPIPEFRPRNRGEEDPYVPRSIADRTGRSTLTLQLYDNGYESA